MRGQPDDAWLRRAVHAALEEQLASLIFGDELRAATWQRIAAQEKVPAAEAREAAPEERRLTAALRRQPPRPRSLPLLFAGGVCAAAVLGAFLLPSALPATPADPAPEPQLAAVRIAGGDPQGIAHGRTAPFAQAPAKMSLADPREGEAEPRFSAAVAPGAEETAEDAALPPDQAVPPEEQGVRDAPDLSPEGVDGAAEAPDGGEEAAPGDAPHAGGGVPLRRTAPASPGASPHEESSGTSIRTAAVDSRRTPPALTEDDHAADPDAARAAHAPGDADRLCAPEGKVPGAGQAEPDAAAPFRASFAPDDSLLITGMAPLPEGSLTVAIYACRPDAAEGDRLPVLLAAVPVTHTGSPGDPNRAEIRVPPEKLPPEVRAGGVRLVVALCPGEGTGQEAEPRSADGKMQAAACRQAPGQILTVKPPGGSENPAESAEGALP